MNECQKQLLGLLKELDALCSEHGIEYWLAGGSFVGAVRNGGFLPWDDDADVHMMPDGAKRLKQLHDEGRLPAGRALVAKEGTNGPWWRYIDTQTTTILRSGYAGDSPQGQFIDIFPLCYAPDIDHEEILDSFNLYCELLTEPYMVNSRRSDSLIAQYNKVSRHPAKRQRLLKQLEDRLFGSAEVPGEWLLICSSLAPNPLIKREWFGTPQRVPFEDTELCIAAQPEQVLRWSYGESWCDIPRLTERGSHVFVSDFDFSYGAYQRDLHATIDRHAHRKLDIDRKNAWFDSLAERNHVNPATHELGCILVACDTEAFVSENAIDLDEMVDQRRYDGLKTIFDRYYRSQFKEPVTYYGNVFADMPDKLLWAAWTPFVMEGEYGRASKVIRLRREKKPDQPLDEQLERLERTCDLMRELMGLWYTDKAYDEAAGLIASGRILAPDCVAFMRFELKDALRGACGQEDAGRILEMAEGYLRLWPDDGELNRYRGDALMGLGRADEALEAYRKAEFFLVNGLVLTETRRLIAGLESQGGAR